MHAVITISSQEEEQARLTRIQQVDEAVTEFDKRVRPYIDTLQQEADETTAAAAGSFAGNQWDQHKLCNVSMYWACLQAAPAVPIHSRHWYHQKNYCSVPHTHMYYYLINIFTI